MPKIVAQQGLEERLVENEELEEACDELRQYREEVKAARDTMVKDALERFRARETELAGKFNVEANQQIVATAQQGFIRDYAAGTLIRSGRWVHEVEEYQTMEKVERGKALRVKKPRLAPQE